MSFSEKLVNLNKITVLAVIGIYQKWISPMRMPCCRFYPSCSEYAKESIETHRLLKGATLAVWRILRCHPFSGGGYDPVLRSEKKEAKNNG